MEFEVVIPTIKTRVRTLDSIPDDVPTHVISDGTLNEARNMGVERVESDVVIIMDDDIAFPESTLYDLAEHVTPETLIGIQDWDLGLIAGRVMAFHKDLWRDIGGFDERLRSHNGDTDFAVKAAKHGYAVQRLPREWFDHEEHPRSVTTWDRAWRLGYLCLKHPTWTPRFINGFVL